MSLRFMLGFDSQVSYKPLTKLVHSITCTSSMLGIGGTGGNTGCSSGGGPDGTLVPFGVNLTKLPSFSGLAACSLIFDLGVLLPFLPCRPAGATRLAPLELSSDVTSTADHGVDPVPSWLEQKTLSAADS